MSEGYSDSKDNITLVLLVCTIACDDMRYNVSVSEYNGHAGGRPRAGF